MSAPIEEIPEVPTLGWLGVTDMGFPSPQPTPGKVLGMFRRRQHHVDGGAAGLWSNEYVVSWTPAAAVPVEALEHLRAVPTLYMPSPEDVLAEVTDVLAAVDAANGTDR